MPNYTSLAQLAKRLVQSNGRLCSFIQYAQRPADSAEPWRGAVDPRASVVQSVSLSAVAVDVGTAQRLGMAAIPEDLLKRISEFLIVAPGAGFKGDLKKIHEVADTKGRFAVVDVQELKPANVTLLYYVGLSR